MGTTRGSAGTAGRGATTADRRVTSRGPARRPRRHNRQGRAAEDEEEDVIVEKTKKKRTKRKKKTKTTLNLDSTTDRTRDSLDDLCEVVHVQLSIVLQFLNILQ